MRRILPSVYTPHLPYIGTPPVIEAPSELSPEVDPPRLDFATGPGSNLFDELEKAARTNGSPGRG